MDKPFKATMWAVLPKRGQESSAAALVETRGDARLIYDRRFDRIAKVEVKEIPQRRRAK